MFYGELEGKGFPNPSADLQIPKTDTSPITNPTIENIVPPAPAPTPDNQLPITNPTIEQGVTPGTEIIAPVTARETSVDEQIKLVNDAYNYWQQLQKPLDQGLVTIGSSGTIGSYGYTFKWQMVEEANRRKQIYFNLKNKLGA